MKNKYADRPGWRRILQKQYRQTFVDDRGFRGYVTMLSLQRVKEPLVVSYGEREICIADDGYVWLMFFPEGEPYSATVMIGRDGKVVQWYFDIIKSQGLTNGGIPYIEDLYLDVVLLPNGEIYVLDEDELNEALERRQITDADYERSHAATSSLTDALRCGANPIVNQTLVFYEIILNEGEIRHGER
ncbi:DUF402 domain-containing protein [Paenibacillus thermotolerans]|uniref:DUF402 domain-containing protein n=1 Tax=Paenibacillus thermotolerans TaxID=3027807 RepID=UPI0023683D01|nr:MULTISPECIES: DUF402 domain-containing protein [unclassified Paenibacillus]